MKDRKMERRTIQPAGQQHEPERRFAERRGLPKPPMPGAIRPAPGVQVFRERRRFPESGRE